MTPDVCHLVLKILCDPAGTPVPSQLSMVNKHWQQLLLPVLRRQRFVDALRNFVAATGTITPHWTTVPWYAGKQQTVSVQLARDDRGPALFAEAPLDYHSCPFELAGALKTASQRLCIPVHVDLVSDTLKAECVRAGYGVVWSINNIEPGQRPPDFPAAVPHMLVYPPCTPE